MWTVRSCVVVSCLLVLLPALAGSAAMAGEEPKPTREAEEPELKGEARKKHEKEVKAILRYLHKEKNRALVIGKIQELGVQRTRAARDALMRFVVGNKNQAFVYEALFALAKIKGKKTIDFLCGKYALRSRDFLVQHTAAEALAEAKDKRATDPLLEVMTAKRSKIKVVSACATSLAKIAPKHERVVAVLFKYSHHRKDTIRSYVIAALGHLRSDEAIARLADALENDKNTRVREYAAQGLGESKRFDALPYLEKALAKETAHTVRTACMAAIRKIQGE